MNYLSLMWAVVIVSVALGLKYFLDKKFGDGSDAVLYEKKSRLMNDSELAFFVNLKQALGDRYLIFCKVRIEDFVGVKKEVDSRKTYGLRGRIKSRHVDFLVCDSETTAPLLAIEVNGKSHERADQAKRDEFVVKLYESVGLAFRSVAVGSDFHAEAEAVRNMFDGDVVHPGNEELGKRKVSFPDNETKS